jgi:hypothetical protein
MIFKKLTLALFLLSLVSSAMAASKLGDLSKFKKITVDTDVLVKTGDLAAAKTRIKDLETSWDEAEPSLKPRSASDWHTLDKGIDRALAALRESPANKAACEKIMSELLALFNQEERK